MVNKGLTLSTKDLADLKELVRQRYSVEISEQELLDLANMLIELFKIVGRTPKKLKCGI